MSTDYDKAMKALITGYRQDQETFFLTSTNVHLDRQTEELLHLPLPVISKDDELLVQALSAYEAPRTPLSPLTPTPQKRPRQEDVLQNVLKEVNLENWEELPLSTPRNENEPPTKRRKLDPQLSTYLKGLPADRSKWTPGDWKRVKIINKYRSTHSSSENAHNQDNEAEERPTSPLQMSMASADLLPRLAGNAGGVANPCDMSIYFFFLFFV